MKKIIITQIQLLILMIMIFSNVINAQASDSNKLLTEAKKISKEAYLKFDKPLFLKSNGLCERVLSAEPNNQLALYYSGYNQYRLINMAMAYKNMPEFDEYYDSAIEKVKQLTEVDEYKSESKVLLAAIYLMKLAVDQSEAPTISKKIHSYLEQAIETDSTNSRAYLIKGNMLFNTPPMFGGSIDGALENFDKAISIYESETDSTKQIDWGYLETLAWKGMALSKKEDFANAKIVYEKALEVEPNFGWVKYKLLPSLKSNDKINGNSTTESMSNLNLIITGFENDNGQAMIALNNSKENYEDNKNSFRRMKMQIINGTVECKFNNLPFGEYAISCFHDENSNSKLDKNFMGIPKEAYGFSNDARGMFGPPDFEDVKFTIDKKQVKVKFEVN